MSRPSTTAPPRPCGPPALPLDQHGPHLRVGRDHRDRPVHVRPPDRLGHVGPVAVTRSSTPTSSSRRELAATAVASPGSIPRSRAAQVDRPVHGAGVEPVEAEPLRPAPRDTVDLPEPAGPSIAMIGGPPGRRCAGHRPISGRRRAAVEVVDESRDSWSTDSQPDDRRRRPAPGAASAGDRGGHRHPVVADGRRPEHRRSGRPVPVTTRSSPTDLRAGTERPDELGGAGQAIRLLDPELADVAERGLALGRRGGDGEDRHLVERGDLGGVDDRARAAARLSRSPSRWWSPGQDRRRAARPSARARRR